MCRRIHPTLPPLVSGRQAHGRSRRGSFIPLIAFTHTKSRVQTERIIDRLNVSGFAYSEISVLMPETGSHHDIGHVKASEAPEGTATGGITGGIAGVVGLLAGLGALAIPGVGAFIAAGPTMATLSGAALGAATGGVIGGLIGLGMPESEAKIYEGKLRTGNYLIAVHALNEEQIAQASDIFTEAGAQDICTTTEASIPKPAAAATPVTAQGGHVYSGVLDWGKNSPSCGPLARGFNLNEWRVLSFRSACDARAAFFLPSPAGAFRGPALFYGISTRRCRRQ
jgi:hypothetical protein